jgi:ABC-type spermidine/putrescine transport system permease subunit I
VIVSSENVIEMRVNEIAQLFHTLDPFPFREKDLDREAEEYIVGWARELPAHRPFRIVVHFPDDESQRKAALEMREAFSRYFAGRAAVIQGDLNELFRIGRRSLGIGLCVLLACLFLGRFVAGYLADASGIRLVEESFLILGWVANWRPLEIFLYDWWPMAHRRDLYRRLSASVIEPKPYPVATCAAV